MPLQQQSFLSVLDDSFWQHDLTVEAWLDLQANISDGASHKTQNRTNNIKNLSLNILYKDTKLPHRNSKKKQKITSAHSNFFNQNGFEKAGLVVSL